MKSLKFPAGGSQSQRRQKICIYTYAVELLTGPSLAIFKVINWAEFVFIKTLFVKHSKIGFQHIFIKRNLRAQMFNIINWAKLAFFWTPNLAQLITLTWPS